VHRIQCSRRLCCIYVVHTLHVDQSVARCSFMFMACLQHATGLDDAPRQGVRQENGNKREAIASRAGCLPWTMTADTQIVLAGQQCALRRMLRGVLRRWCRGTWRWQRVVNSLRPPALAQLPAAQEASMCVTEPHVFDSVADHVVALRAFNAYT
jgi:hypothetical protein